MSGYEPVIEETSEGAGLPEYGSIPEVLNFQPRTFDETPRGSTAKWRRLVYPFLAVTLLAGSVLFLKSQGEIDAKAEVELSTPLLGHRHEDHHHEDEHAHSKKSKKDHGHKHKHEEKDTKKSNKKHKEADEPEEEPKEKPNQPEVPVEEPAENPEEGPTEPAEEPEEIDADVPTAVGLSCDGICQGEYPYGCNEDIPFVVEYRCNGSWGCEYARGVDEPVPEGFCTFKTSDPPTTMDAPIGILPAPIFRCENEADEDGICDDVSVACNGGYQCDPGIDCIDISQDCV